ncbi:MAG: hypothetical protein HY794_10620 [Desulfarculus sp.]|nr:hypothetical protein [Desulfarculus sp.]
MRTAERLSQLRRDCAGHSAGEYTLLAALLGAGLATAVITFLSANQGAAILTASRLG